MQSLRRTTPLLLAGLFVSSAAGCSLFPDDSSRSEISVYSTHSGTPDSDELPNYGGKDTARQFQNDMGWDITIQAAYVTTTRVALIPCGSTQGPLLDMFYGPCAENFISLEDGQVLGLGTVSIDDDQYCTIRVEHGHFDPDPDSPEPHASPDNDEILGKTIYVQLVANKDGGENVDVTMLSDTTFAVDVDVSSIENGGPITLDEESFTYKVTLDKIYDRWFDGIDFDDFTEAEVEAAIIAGLEHDTFAVQGTDVRFD